MAKQYYVGESDRRKIQENRDAVKRMVRRDKHRRRSHGGGGGGSRMRIASVVSSAGGGGYYSCKFQSLDADYWESDTDVCYAAEGEDSVVVLNLVEAGTAQHRLSSGDKIICWQMSDDEGNSRYVGTEVFGRNDFYICT